MGVTVQPGFRTALRPEATVLFTVLTDDPVGRLAPALAAFGQQLMSHDLGSAGPLGPKYVSGPVSIPGGQLMMMDLGDTPRQVLQTLPDRLVEQLAAAGISDAVIDLPVRMGDRHGAIRAFAPAARAFLAPPPGRPRAGWADPPLRLLDQALAWLKSEPGPDLAPLGLVISAEIPLTWPAATSAGAALLASGSTPSVTMVTDFATAAAAAVVINGFHGATPRASLTAAGAGFTPAEIADRMRRQREMIRGYPHELGWAAVTADHDGRRMAFWDWEERVADRPVGAEPRQFWEMASDVLVPDAMWYQVLSAGHLERLGAPPPGAVALREGIFELTVGEPEQWLPGHPDRTHVQEQGRALLTGCLATARSGGEVTRTRLMRWRTEDTEGIFRAP